MLADAGDEGMLLIRHFDTEVPDPSATASTVRNFMQRIHLLFNEKQALELPGHTKEVMAYLQDAHYFYVGCKVHTVGAPGGPRPDVVARCFGRLQAWVRLASDVVRAECPSFEIVTATAAFDLTQTVQEEHLSRLALVFGCDEVALRREFSDFRPMAIAIQQRGEKCSNLEAWRAAIQSTARADARRRHPCSQLQLALTRFAALLMSTSGIEHNFSAGKRVLGEQRNGAAEETEANLFFLLFASESSLAETLTRAQAVWKDLYPVSRSGQRRRRADQHVPRAKPVADSSGGKLSERSFLRTRHAAVGEALRKRQGLSGDKDGNTEDGEDPFWTAGHRTERIFQQDKLRKRKIEHLQVHHLFPHEVDEHLCQESHEDQDRFVKASLARQRKRARIADALEPSPPTTAELVGQHVFIPDTLRTPEMQRRAHDLHWTFASREWDARLFISACPLSPGPLVNWAVVLSGGWILNVPAALGCQRGAFLVKFRPALKTRRKVWVTEAFKLESPSRWDLIQHMLGGGLWKLLHSLEEFAAAKDRAVATRNAATVVALASAEEARMYANAVKHVMTGKQFLTFVAVVDRSRGV
jgi:hypothetical protein